MNISTLCLAILSFGDSTGYEIRKLSTDGKYSYFVDASFGAIYPALSKLAADGFVTLRNEAQDGKPARKIYSITDKGRQELERALTEHLAPDRIKSEFLLAALCAEHIDQATMERHIDARIEQINEQVCEIGSYAEGEHDDHEPTRWVVEFAHKMNQTKLAFLRENRDRILACARKTPVSEAAE